MNNFYCTPTIVLKLLLHAGELTILNVKLNKEKKLTTERIRCETNTFLEYIYSCKKSNDPLTEWSQKLNENFQKRVDVAKGMFLLLKVPRTPIKGVFRECIKLFILFNIPINFLRFCDIFGRNGSKIE